MRILITGVAGFIGQRLADRLVREGHYVIGTGRQKKADHTNLGEYRAADLSHTEECGQLVVGVDAVVHCAGKAGAWGAYQEYEDANITATGNLVAACKQASVKRFVNISSPSIYFAYRDQLSLKETDLPARFSNAYAATKYVAEQLVSEAHDASFATVSLRPRGVIGAGDRNWLPRIIQLRQANRLVQPGGGRNLAEFTSVENLLDAIGLCLTVPSESLRRVFNITNGRPEPLWQVIEDALRSVGLDGKRQQVPLVAAMTAARISEFAHRLLGAKNEPELLPIKVGVAGYSMTLDISLAKDVLGFQPRMTTAQSIEEFAQWWLTDHPNAKLH